ncbi:MAG: hypothetical protein IJI36_02095 [Kiritimatiellae bacterium]|nr:hypothetical protein [Kiritimatiellia bacterium]
MMALFQTVLMRLALCGLAASLILLVLRSRIARDTFARLLSIWRSLTAFGRVAVCSFLLIGVLVGGDKTNGVNNLPPQQMMSPMAQQGSGFLLTGLLVNGNLANVMNFVQPQTTFAERKTANWNIRGAWKDSFWLDFEDGWAFPWGTNHLTGVEVVSYGQVWATPFDTNAVASAGAPFEIVPGLTTFACEFTPSNSYRFVWTDAAINRDTNNLVSASLELFRDGDVSVATNGIAALLPRTLPFPHSGFGQDDEWGTANFTNATEILAVGYPQWVDAQVGDGLTNGLYKLSVTVADDPPEATFLSVGDLSVAVTNAGEYVFLLEKGPAYDLTVFPPSSNVTISAVDDVPTMRGTPMMRSAWSWGDGTWSVDMGEFVCDYYPGMPSAVCWWLPWLCGSPDVVHIDPTTGPVTFHANLFDYRGGAASFLWAGSDALTIASPNSQTTAVTADLADWRLANLSVTASFGLGRSLTSYLDVSYGTNDSPQVSCSLSVQSVHFINEGDRPERIYPVSVSLLCPVETNGVVNISHEGSDGTLFWSDASATQPLSSLTGISLSSVTEESGGASYTFYMTSPNIGSGSFTASFTLPSGETRGAAQSYRAIEPIRKLITNDRDETSRGIINPSRLIYDPNHEVFENPDAVLSVSANGQFGASEVRWSVVSGPGEIVSTNGWRSTVRATAATGTVVVEARFNDDDLQPRFVLPIVVPREIPIKAFVVSAPDDEETWDNDEIEAQVGFANLIYRQVGIKFHLASTTQNVGTAEDWSIKPIYRIPIIGVERLTSAFRGLLDSYSTGDCVEVYFLGKFHETKALALWTEYGIAITKESPSCVLAHELGHAFDLQDCYCDRPSDDGEAPITLSNAGSAVAADMFASVAVDWCAGSGRGFTESSDTRLSTIKTLLMHGCSSKWSSLGYDIPSGAVKGLHNGSADGNDSDFVNVGAEQLKPVNMEVYSR